MQTTKEMLDVMMLVTPQFSCSVLHPKTLPSPYWQRHTDNRNDRRLEKTF